MASDRRQASGKVTANPPRALAPAGPVAAPATPEDPVASGVTSRRPQISVESRCASVGPTRPESKVTLSRAYPVSYTHLDVYKRQVVCRVDAEALAAGEQASVAGVLADEEGHRARPGHLGHGEQDGQGRRATGVGADRVGIPAPVSYTHLDVYKRQFLV